MILEIEWGAVDRASILIRGSKDLKDKEQNCSKFVLCSTAWIWISLSTSFLQGSLSFPHKNRFCFVLRSSFFRKWKSLHQGLWDPVLDFSMVFDNILLFPHFIHNFSQILQIFEKTFLRMNWVNFFVKIVQASLNCDPSRLFSQTSCLKIF